MLISLALLLPAALAPPCPQDSSFDADLKKIHRYIDQRRWKEADKNFLALLLDYERQDVVYCNRALLLEDAKRIQFWKKATLPEPSTLISGDLQPYKAGSTAKVKVVYEGSYQDFKTYKSGVMVHPIRFEGEAETTWIDHLMDEAMQDQRLIAIRSIEPGNRSH